MRDLLDQNSQHDSFSWGESYLVTEASLMEGGEGRAALRIAGSLEGSEEHGQLCRTLQ